MVDFLEVHCAEDVDRRESILTSPAPPPSLVQRRLVWEYLYYGRSKSINGYWNASHDRRSHLCAVTYGLTKDPLFRWSMGKTADERRKVIAAPILKAVEGYEADSGLLLLGRSKVGKTTGVVHGMLALWERRMAKPMNWPNLVMFKAVTLGVARRNHPLGEGDPPSVRQAKEAQLLFVDDLGQDERRDNTIFEILDARYDAGLPSVVTSGCSVEKLTELYGEALVRRILESGSNVGKLVNLFPKAPSLKAVGS